MITGFVADAGRLRRLDDPLDSSTSATWVDLLNPSKDEEAALERWLGIAVPTREEMEEIEASSRLYYEEGAAFMTATLPSRADTDNLLMAPVTFVLTASKLVTIRYHEPRVFHTFPQRAEKVNLGCTDHETVLVALLEAAVDRIADILERAQRDVDAISRGIFQNNDQAGRARQDLTTVLRQIGRKGDLSSNIRDSLGSLLRLSSFFSQMTAGRKNDQIRSRIRTLARDIQSLNDHVAFLSQKITFLLDATLGMINIEQSNIIKIFSVAAGVFLPPTLIASIYGMNFTHMPEFAWRLGYPFALLLMLLSAVVPFWFFKRRGWL